MTFDLEWLKSCLIYKPYLRKDGQKKLAQIIRQQTGSEKRDFVKARKRVEDKLSQISNKIDNLLDNITESNHKYVDRRLKELDNQRQQFEQRLEELERLSISQAEIQAILTDSIEFISNLEFTFDKGVPQEKLVALRQCIEKVWINKITGEIKLAVRVVPTGNLKVTEELTAFI